MVGPLLLRGMLVGVFAGLRAFGFARIFGEPQVDRAIAFEEQMNQSKGEVPEPELVSRETQAGLGLFTGVIVYGAAVGGLFSLVFRFRLWSRWPPRTSRHCGAASITPAVTCPAATMISTTGSAKSAAHSNCGLSRSRALSTERRHRMSSRCGRRALHEPAGRLT